MTADTFIIRKVESMPHPQWFLLAGAVILTAEQEDAATSPTRRLLEAEESSQAPVSHKMPLNSHLPVPPASQYKCYKLGGRSTESSAIAKAFP